MNFPVPVNERIKKIIDEAVKYGKAFLKTYWFFLLVLALRLLQGTAFAWDIPTGGFGYDVYHIFIQDMAKGPIGFVVGSGLVAGAIFAASRSAWVPAVTLAIGGGLIYKLDSLAESLGFNV